MKCPHCAVDLIMSDRQGIEIDYCPQCRGVWLDRGELDKIVERSTQTARPPEASRDHHDDDDDRRPLNSHDSHHGYQVNRKRSWLGELFG